MALSGQNTGMPSEGSLFGQVDVETRVFQEFVKDAPTSGKQKLEENAAEVKQLAAVRVEPGQVRRKVEEAITEGNPMRLDETGIDAAYADGVNRALRESEAAGAKHRAEQSTSKARAKDGQQPGGLFDKESRAAIASLLGYANFFDDSEVVASSGSRPTPKNRASEPAQGSFFSFAPKL